MMTGIGYLNTNGEVVLLDVFVVQRVVDFDISPRVTVIRALLQVERVILVGLRCRSWNQPVENNRVVLNARTVHNETRLEIIDIVGARANNHNMM